MHDRSLLGRHTATVRGLWKHVQPIFLLPGAAMSVFGALLAAEFSVGPAIGHVLAVSLAVYVAHLKDGYVDYYVRGEDETNPLSPRALRLAIGLATAGATACIGFLWLRAAAELVAVVLTVPLVVLGHLHAPSLDTGPVTGTADYPLGIVLAMLGGYAAQTGTVSAAVIAVCLALFPLLVGTNVLLDIVDYRHDRRLSKRTIPVALGPSRARFVAIGFIFASVGLLGVAIALGALSQRVAVAGIVPACAGTWCLTGRYSADRAVRVLIGATYAFAGVLFLAIQPDFFI
ncbi:UbiA family prenyltransferase [Natrialba taiwanensis]|uniref:UbiA family prenyltransferase n=1 Tax=Natrialba taiwanensis TaxID=160846 RepID=UPI000B2527EB|nr:UbiA family prenyltransferase [Natrialba taiwanensis]